MEDIGGDRAPIGIAKVIVSAIVAPRFPWCSNAGSGAADPNAERLDAFFQTVNIDHIELEVHKSWCTMPA
jgi:hypothetical protein